jgi:hypothetical protein
VGSSPTVGSFFLFVLFITADHVQTGYLNFESAGGSGHLLLYHVQVNCCAGCRWVVSHHHHLFHPHQGLGVIGLTTALKLQEEGYQVTIIAEIFPTDPKSPKYTSQWAVSTHHYRSSHVLICAPGRSPCQLLTQRGSTLSYVEI